MSEKYYDLTAPQQAIWLTEQYYQNTNVNNVCGTFYSSEKLDFNVLKKSLNIFLKNNDSFKIKLIQKKNDIKQYFCEMQDIDFGIINIRNREEQTALEEKIASEVFSMLDSFLFKIVLFRYPDGHGGFVINSHHIISDSWTNGIVANEVALIYAKLKNQETYSKDASLSYKTYLQSEADYKQSEKFQKDKAYWEEVFTTVPEVASIPSIKENTKDKNSLEANRVLLSLDSSVLNTLQEYCKRNKVSLYNFFMMVFSLYLGRVSSLDEFVIGTPILNRTNFKEKQTTGMFINTLPLKINLFHEKTFLENLRTLAVRSMALLRHQKYSFQYIIEDLRKRDANLPKLYNVVYSYQITKMNENMNALQHSTSWTFNKTVADDLDIHMFEWNEDNAIQIAYDYKINKYDEQDIRDIHARILHVINQVLENESILLKEIEIVTPEEKHQILYDFNNTAVDYPKDKTIVDLFEEQVEKTPDNIAVVFEDQKLTYRELNEKANALANILLSKGVHVGDVIGVCLQKHPEFIVAVFGILKCGAIYMPIYTGYPVDRISYMLSNSDTKFVITNNEFSSLIDGSLVINIDMVSTFSKSLSEQVQIVPANVAYIIYTSGSTGKPKGVKITHRNLINFVNAFVHYYHGIDSKDSFLSSTNIAFDVSIWEIFMPLLNGAKLYFNSTDTIQDISVFCDNIMKYNINALYIPPNILDNVVSLLSNNHYTKIAKLLVGVEPISNTTLNKYIELNPDVIIVNGYGPTETTICATAFVYKKDISTTHAVSIGKPLYNNHVYILSQRSLCPVNVPGELYVAGAGVGDGYLNNEAKTSMSFNKDIFFNDLKMYATGDVAFWDTHGNLNFVGRRDNQIKLHGYRIELNEIDAAIMQHPLISKSLSVIKNNRIISYYISDEEILTTDIKTFLRSSLPFYMLPSHCIRLESFPLTINGKVDRQNLPEPHLALSNNYIAPQTSIQKEICMFLEDLLNFSKISITDDFFEIGVDSLIAIQLSIMILKSYNVNISIKDIFKYSNIERLSAYISTLAQRGQSNTIQKFEKRSTYSLSSAQRRIYYSSLKDKNSLLYNIAGGIILDGSLDRKKIENCFHTLIKRHSSLRTHFEEKENNVVQVVEENIPFALSFEKINSNDINAVYHRFVKPFDLSKAPLFRVELVELENKKDLLLLDMHHIISDGTSLNILIKELCDLYNNQELSSKEIDYKDFAVWEQNQLQSEEMKKAKEYWGNQFQDDIPLLNMPTSYPRPTIQSFEGSNYFASLDFSTCERIAKVSKKLNVTPYMLLLSVYYILLSKYTSQDDIVVGTPIVGRELPELSNLLGMFVNSLPMRNKINHTLSFSAFCKNIKSNCMSAFAHQTYPFDVLVNDLNIKRNTSRNPLFDTMFIYQNEGYPSIDFKDIEAEYYIPNNPISKFDLSLEIVPINGEFRLRFEYCTNLFSEEFIQRFSTHYINILDAILNDTTIKIADIDMLSAEEKQHILYNFNNTTMEYPHDNNIVQVFEEQVKNTPNNTALILNKQRLTYQTLNNKANQLANYLLANSIGNTSIVGVMLPKSFELIATMLAVLKLNATYILIDSSLPKDRINYMLQNAGVSLLITNSSQPDIDFENTLDLEDYEQICNVYDNSNLNIPFERDHTVTILYTSGSTGTPKGVPLHNQGIMNILLAHKLHMSTDKCKNFLSFSSVSFDMFQVEVLVPLLSGAQIVIANEEEQRNPLLLAELIKQYQIHFVLSTPSKISLVFEQAHTTLSSLKVIQLGGEKLSSNIVHLIRTLSDASIYNAYGPSEITAFCSCKEITGSDITIGKPICNMGIVILDKYGNLLPVGIPGEICIYGVGLSKGYVNQSELTRKSFVTLPWLNKTIYKSGDIGYLNESNELIYLDRKDNQIKLRGLRIELAEIQNVLLNYPNITNCCVFVKNHEYLSAFIVSSKRLDTRDIRNYLKAKLPLYMVPRYITQIDEMPINNNGKIDINSLHVYPENLLTNDYVAPTTEKEKVFCALWETLLHTKVGIHDDIFELGADSLLAIKFKTLLTKHNMNVLYSDIFKYPTIHELCKESKSIDSNNSISNYNYSAINDLLSTNDIKYANSFITSTHNNVLLLGSNGFVGMHIIDSFIKKDTGKIYCLIREKNNISSTKRFIDTLHYYFGNKLDEYLNTRIFILTGDILEENFGLSSQNLSLLNHSVDIVIDTAANVKHYGKESEFKKINVDSVQNIVQYCTNYGKKLIYISSLSVSGNNTLEENHNFIEDTYTFSEKDLYFGQHINNLYVKSKFLAERFILQNVHENGLEAQIYRIGNITNRYSDGKFQVNYTENAFANKLKALISLKCVPKSLLNSYVEFSPVDYCADAIITLMQNYLDSSTVFHIYNHHHVYISELISMLNMAGIPLKVVDNHRFRKVVNKMIDKNPSTLNAIINDFDNDTLSYQSNISITSDFSMFCFRLFHFSWPNIDESYIKKYIQYFNNIDFLKEVS